MRLLAMEARAIRLFLPRAISVFALVVGTLGAFPLVAHNGLLPHDSIPIHW